MIFDFLRKLIDDIYNLSQNRRESTFLNVFKKIIDCPENTTETCYTNDSTVGIPILII